ncbi:MAG: hypothetical protein CBC46_03645 [Verrucomicrobiaceae bacterium TMED86]|nr:MAG: hypothetical protein CBC46_03645 [Verrucomicrobiaceae bacterium TMED86]
MATELCKIAPVYQREVLSFSYENAQSILGSDEFPSPPNPLWSKDGFNPFPANPFLPNVFRQTRVSAAFPPKQNS